MIRKILPILLPVVALMGGIAAGTVLQPGGSESGGAHAAAAESHGDDNGGGHDEAAAHASDSHASNGHGGAEGDGPGFFTFPSQFFVPLARNGDMGAMIILTLVLETKASKVEALEKQEHRLRDALLRQLLIHANTSGFDGNYTVDRNLERLRTDLLRVARGATDIPIDAVLIQDIVRQNG